MVAILKSMNSSKNYIIVVLLIVVASLTALVYVQSQESGSTDDAVMVDTTTDTELSQKEVSIIAGRIRDHIMVPSEAPSLSVVLNAENLRAEQSFYSRVENGDVIAVYPVNRLAILYRPSEDILINVGPLYLEEQNTSAATSSQ